MVREICISVAKTRVMVSQKGIDTEVSYYGKFAMFEMTYNAPVEMDVKCGTLEQAPHNRTAALLWAVYETIARTDFQPGDSIRFYLHDTSLCDSYYYSNLQSPIFTRGDFGPMENDRPSDAKIWHSIYQLCLRKSLSVTRMQSATQLDRILQQELRSR